MIAIACAWAILAAGSGIVLAAAAPRAFRPVLRTTALIVILGALAAVVLPH